MHKAVEVSLILQEAWAAGIQMRVRNGKVVLSGPHAAMSAELLARIRDNKTAIIERLEKIEAVFREIGEPLKPTEPISAEPISIEGSGFGLWDHKSTASGQTPPAQRVAQGQAWLASIDWRYGLRCGLTGEQCRVCKGMPCHDSAEWDKKDTA